MTTIVSEDPTVQVRASPERLWVWLVLGVVVLTLARLAFAALCPLTEDEAYYRLWAGRLDFGYFDHPPMVAWWIAIGRTIFGDTPLGIRVLAVLASSLATLVIPDIAIQLGLSRRTGARAALWYNATFLIAFGGAFMIPDAPATLFWTLGLWAIARAWRTNLGWWWLLAGLAAGGAALSKYSGLFIGPGVLLWLLCTDRGRTWLARPWPWLALVVGAVVFAPNVVWNADHHWMSFAKQFSRITPSGFTPRHVFDFPATQFFLLNPILAVFAGRGLAFLRWRDPNEAGLLLLPLGVTPFLVYLILHSLHAGVQAHWPAPLYPAVAILAAYGADHVTGRTWRTAATILPWLGFCTVLAWVHCCVPQTDFFGRRDFAIPLRGWPMFAVQVEQARSKAKAGWVGTMSYGTAAELVDQNAGPAPVTELIERARYSFDPHPPPLIGPGVVVELARRMSSSDLTPCFRSVTPLPDIQRSDGKVGIRYRAFLVTDPTVDLAADGCRAGKDRTP